MAHQRRPRDLLITCIKPEGNILKFWALPLQNLDNVKQFENLLKSKEIELENSRGPLRSDQITIGSLWVAKSKIKGGWCRARALSYHGISNVFVHLIDYGNEEIVHISLLRSVDNSVFSLPGQAQECILADVVARGSEWSPEALRVCEQEMLFNTLSGSAVSKYMNIPMIRVAKKGESEPFVQRLINQGLAAIRDESLCPPPAPASYRFCNMDQNTIHMVRVSCVESIHKFYVQLTAAEMELKHLMDSINSISPERFPFLSSLTVNSPCLAQLSNKPCLYRALVMNAQQTKCKVFFVDYGYIELKDVSELRQIPPTFLALPAQAISCSLPMNVNISSDDFRRLVTMEILECHVVNRTPEAYVVKLMCKGVDILVPLQSYTQQKLNVGTQCDVTVSYVNDISEFYIQLNHFKDHQAAISSKLNSGCNFIPISFMECTPGAAVCVKYSEDNLWYRARIISVKHESDISVFFVDFGNCDSVSLSAVRKLSPELMKFPIQAFRCYLFDTPMLDDQKFKDDAFELFEQLTTDQSLVAHIKAFTEGSSYGVVLLNPTSKMSINDAIKALALSIPKVPVKEVENIYVTSFQSPSCFFAQLEKLDSEQLESMQSAINEFYTSMINTSFVPSEGSLVCAKFELDESYYRARVEKCLSNACQVFFLDYGNREIISNADIHPMDISFTKYPEFGVQCGFLDVPDVSLNDQLSSLMLENSFQARMVKQDGCKWLITLTETFSSNEPVLQVLRMKTNMPRSIHGQGYSANKERPYNAPTFNAEPTRYGTVSEQRGSSERDVNSIPLPENKTFKEYSLLSIPPNAFRNVYVSHVVSPGEFYCQIEEDSPKLTSLMKSIEEVYSHDDGSLHLMNYSVDAPCCAMFEDNVWYRGKIQEIHENSCDIFFVDYGNTDEVTNSKIKKLRSDMFRLPVQALQCKVFNVSPKGRDWSDDEINAFLDSTLEKSFVANFVECDANGVYAVNLVSIGKLQHDTFNLEFVGSGFGRFQDPSKAPAVIPKAPAVIPIAPALIPKAPAVVSQAPPVKSHPVPAFVSLKSQQIQVAEGGRKSEEPVTFTFGLNPGEVFCQLKATSMSFTKMMTSLQNYYNKISDAELLVDQPQVGMVCIAQFHLDNAWYRAEIKKIESGKIFVFYVDYGNMELVNKKKIRCIVEQDDFISIPMQAIKCRIRGIKPPGQSWIVNHSLGNYFEGNAVCNFIKKLDDGYLVDVTCNGKNVAELLVKDKLAVPDGSVQFAVTQVLKSRAPAVAKTQVSSKKLPERQSFILGQLLSVIVSFIESPKRFWCQVADEAAVLDELMAEIETHCQDSTGNELYLKVGNYCLSQYYVDEAWYRAVVTECLPDNSYKVFFFDYGNAEVVTQSQIKDIPEQFLKIPPQCFECCLKNCPSKTTPEMKDLFQGVVDEAEEITAKVESLGPSACVVTLLYEKDDEEISVSELLFGECIEESVSVPLESFPKFLPPDIPLGLQEGFVSVVNSPHDFFIQLSGTEDPLAELSAELAELCETSSENVPDLCVGYACCAKYSEDNNWYRAEVTAVHDSTVDVYFVDYGNEDTVEKRAVRKLTEKHLQMPPLSIRCKLNGVGPITEGWTTDATNSFQEMLGEDCLGITFISKDIPVPVNITKDDKEISQVLVDMELAVVETCAETDEAYAEDHLAPPVEDPLSSLPSDQSYPKRKIASNKVSVKICFVDNCSKFYVMPVELNTELDTVMTTLELLYSDESKVSGFVEDPKVSMPCVAKYSEDEAWYRALITYIDGESFKVTFVDYGNSELTTIENLRPIAPEVVKIPPIALEVSLYGVEAIPGKESEITALFEDYCLNETELEMDILEVDPYLVKLSDNGDLGSILVEKGLAQEKAVEPISEAFEDGTKSSLTDASLEFKIEIHKRLFTDVDKIVGNVKFCEIENDYVTFYVVSENLEAELQNLQEKLQSAYATAPKSLPDVSFMDFCCTKYMEDENWYRAQVLFCDKDKVKVRFIDYGNCETVDRSDIYELLPDFTVEHQFSVKCILYGLKLYKNKEVELQNRLDELVYHDLVELKLCSYSHAMSDPCITRVVCGSDDISEIILNEKLVYKHYVTNLQIDKEFQATIENVASSLVFVFPVHLSGERDAFHFKLQESCKDLNIFPSEISKDQLYAAKHENEWYRVSVIDNSSDMVQVQLVDFGSIVSVSVSDFVLLPDDFCHQPLFLQSCRLESGVVQAEDLVIGSTVSCEALEADPADQTIKIRILGKDSVCENEAEEMSGEVITDIPDNKAASEVISENTEGVTEVITDISADKAVSENTDEVIIEEVITDFSVDEAASEVLSEITDEIILQEVITDNLTDKAVSEVLSEMTDKVIIEEVITDISADKAASGVLSESSDELISALETNETTVAEEKASEIVSPTEMSDDKESEISSEIIDSESINEIVSDTPNDAETNEIKIADEKAAGNLNDIKADFVDEPITNIETEFPYEEVAKIPNDTENTETNITNENSSKILHDAEATEIEIIKKTETGYVAESAETEIEDKATENAKTDEQIVESIVASETNYFQEKTAEVLNSSKTGCTDEASDIFYDTEDTEMAPCDEKVADAIQTCVSNENNLAADEITENLSREQDVNSTSGPLNNNQDVQDYENSNEREVIEAKLENSKQYEIGKLENKKNEVSVLENENDYVEAQEKEKDSLKENQLQDFFNFKESGVLEAGDNVKACDLEMSYSNLVSDTIKPGPVPCDTESDASLKFNVVSSGKNTGDKMESHQEANVPGENKNEGNFDNEITELVKSIDLSEIDKSFKEGDDFDIGDCSIKTREENEDQSFDSEVADVMKGDGITNDLDSGTISEHDGHIIDPSNKNIDFKVTDTSSPDPSRVLDSLADREVTKNNRTLLEPEVLSGTVKVGVSDIAISDGSVIFAVQPVNLQEEFRQLNATMQDYYSSQAESYDDSSEDVYCVVSYDFEWCRGKILHKGDDDWSVLLIDYGKCISVSSSDVKKLALHHCNFPPFAVWCTLVSAFCSEENSECLKEFLHDSLKDSECDIKILEGNEPYKVTLIINELCILSQLLKKGLVTQTLPPMYVEPGCCMAKVTHLNIDSHSCEVFVNLAPFFNESKALHSSMQISYRVEDSVSAVERSSAYAVFHNCSWCRGLVLSTDPVEVYLVDTGENISGPKDLCFLLPEHCLNPPFAIKCKVPSDENSPVEVSEFVKKVLCQRDLIEVEVVAEVNAVSALLTDEQVLCEIQKLRHLDEVSELNGAEVTETKCSSVLKKSCTDAEVEPIEQAEAASGSASLEAM